MTRIKPGNEQFDGDEQLDDFDRALRKLARMNDDGLLPMAPDPPEQDRQKEPEEPDQSPA